MALEAFARATATACAIFSVLGGCSGTFGERVREQVHQSVATGDTPTVLIENVAGGIKVQGSRRSVVDVQAAKYGYDVKELRDVTIDVRRDAGGVSIATHYAGGVRSGGVDYRISVPEGASLHVSNDAGSVDIFGVLGNLDVETQAGQITADAGRVYGDRSIALRATTGAVTLTIAPGSDATVEGVSTVGDFSSDVPGVTQAREHLVGSRGGGTIGNGSGRIRLETTTGAIALRQR